MPDKYLSDMYTGNDGGSEGEGGGSDPDDDDEFIVKNADDGPILGPIVPGEPVKLGTADEGNTNV